ncbi:uncharacterized protein LOC119072275 [Bradysia coprophila]|uniref:uncharacterized protein LOC119072275 n=1 Tax=Bradysia coprophila TaxID=38358 RepID=UPI00187DAE7E|nr:uncharacterized protein LOC119072275 [Bradysia coprophila]
MADMSIYFLLVIVLYSGSIETYFLSDYLDTNLPDRLSDPIDENWQDKRSAENEYPIFSNEFTKSKKSTDFDYRDGNVETHSADGEIGTGDTFKKRESKIGINVDEPFSEADIRKIFSQLSTSDRQDFDGLMNGESPKIDVNKRHLLKQNFENSFHLNKRHDGKMCNGLECDEYNQLDRIKQPISEEDSYDSCPEKVNSKRKSKFKRSHSFRSTPRESILQTKIDILKDNYKRSLEMRLLEDSAKRRYSKAKRKQDNDRQGR